MENESSSKLGWKIDDPMRTNWDFRDINHVRDFNTKLDMLSIVHGSGLMGLSLQRSYRIYAEGENSKSEKNMDIFMSIVDLKITLLNLFCCIRELNDNWRRVDAIRCFRFARLWFEFVCIYRAFYDKYMLLMVKTAWPQSLKQFDNAKSKNRIFYKITSECQTTFVADGVFINIPEDFSKRCKAYIDNINEQYRNPEVHGAGKSRKWIFSQDNETEEKEYKMVGEIMKDMDQFLMLIGVVSGGREFCEMYEGKVKGSKS